MDKTVWTIGLIVRSICSIGLALGAIVYTIYYVRTHIRFRTSGGIKFLTLYELEFRAAQEAQQAIDKFAMHGLTAEQAVKDLSTMALLVIQSRRDIPEELVVAALRRYWDHDATERAIAEAWSIDSGDKSDQQEEE